MTNPLSDANPNFYSPALGQQGLLSVRASGVFVPALTGPDQDRLREEVDALFKQGFYLEGLDYDALMGALFLTESLVGVRELRLANGLARFLPERQELYKEVKLMSGGESAEYFFEPLFITQPVNEPVYSTELNGEKTLLGHQDVLRSVQVQLNFDEFVAALWSKGVRFGILAKEVREIIRTQEASRICVALMREPTASLDAKVLEVSEKMHQDRTPFIASDGRANLRRSKNHFPQANQGEKLLRKIPLQWGYYGFWVTGEPIKPRKPLDLDLNALRGGNTEVVREAHGEFLVATQTGFVMVDPVNHAIGISTNPENRTGVSIRSTGDLQLEVKEFKEHGEVQEGRVIEGQNMTFMAPVYGTVIGKDGNLHLSSRISGGHAQTINGNIVIKGKALNSLIEARGGKVTLGYAEDCTIIGDEVEFQHVVNCEILSERARVGLVEGSMVVGKHLDLDAVRSTKYRDSAVFILLPDTAEIDRRLAEENTKLAQFRQLEAQKREQILRDQGGPLLSRYLNIQERLATEALQLAETELKAVEALRKKFAPLLNSLVPLQEQVRTHHERVRRLEVQRVACNTLGHCHLNLIQDLVKIHFLHSNQGLSPFFPTLRRQEIKSTLEQLSARGDPLKQVDHGSFSWEYKSVWGASNPQDSAVTGQEQQDSLS